MEGEFKTWKEVPTTNRGLEEYLQDLKLTPDLLGGKKILDIGSGTRRFAKELKNAGIKAEVISFDPVFASPEEKSRIQGDVTGKLRKLIQENDVSGVREKTVAGVGEMLPFKDGTFDLVIANNSLPAYGTREQIDRFFEESFRVLKNGGELRYTPSYTMFRRGIEYPLDEDLKNIVKKLESSNKFAISKMGVGQDLTILRKSSKEVSVGTLSATSF